MSINSPAFAITHLREATVSIARITQLILLVSIFVPFILNHTEVSFGSIFVLVMSLLAFFYVSERKVKIDYGLSFFLLLAGLFSLIELFFNQVNPFSLNFLSLIYMTVVLFILLKNVQVKNLVKLLFIIYGTHVSYILFESILIGIGRFDLLNTIGGGFVREDYNQLFYYFGVGIATISSQSLFFMPQSAASLLVFSFYLMFFHSAMSIKYKVILSSVIAMLFVFFAINSTALMTMLFLFLGHFLSRVQVNRATIMMKFASKILGSLIVIVLSWLAVKILILKATYHVRLSAAELQDKTKDIYTGVFSIFKEQDVIDQLFGIGLVRRALLLEHGDCAFGNSMLTFGIIPIFILVFFIGYISLTAFRALKRMNSPLFIHIISLDRSNYIKYLLVSNYLIFLGWIISTVHYSILFVAPGFTLAVLSATIVFLLSFRIKQQQIEML